MQRIVLNEISYFGAGCRSMIADEARRRDICIRKET